MCTLQPYLRILFEGWSTHYMCVQDRDITHLDQYKQEINQHCASPLQEYGWYKFSPNRNFVVPVQSPKTLIVSSFLLAHTTLIKHF